MFKPFELERFFAEHEFTCEYALCCSDPQSFTIKELIELHDNPQEVYDKLLNVYLGYTESVGNPKLREEISKLYETKHGESLGMDNILVHTGAQEVIFTSSKGLLSKDDVVMVQTPCYQSHFEVARAIGCNIIEIPTISEDGRWKIDMNVIEQNLNDKVKMLIINTPHNPTGAHMTHNEQKKIIDLISPFNIILLADEVNQFSEHESHLLLPSFASLYSNCVAIGVISKSFGLPGLRIGWAASQNKELLAKLECCKDYTTITNPAPSEFLTIIALQVKDKILKRNLEIYKKNKKLLQQLLVNYSNYFEWIEPQAGIVGFLKLNWDAFPNKFKSANKSVTEAFCDELLKQKHVLLAPGVHFDPSKSKRYDHFVRIGFGRFNFEEALSKFAEFLKEHF